MPTFQQIGKEIKTIDLLELFQPKEGEITQRYGRIGQGKTYGATADVLQELKRGNVVYTNWRIKYNGFDQRKSWLFVIGSLMFPWRNKLTYFPPENLHYIAIDEHFLDKFEKLTDCSVYLDEGHVVFDSYEMAKMSMQKRTAVLHTRHFNRSIHIISQRPTAVHRMMRANVNRFYKYECLLTKPFLLFMRTEFQDLVDENVDESQPLSRKLYLGSREVFNAYNTKYLRGDIANSQTLFGHVFNVPYYQRIFLIFMLTWDSIASAFRPRK